MFRKLTLLLLFLFGSLCLVAGTIERGLAAEKCADQEPDQGIYCPVQTGDDPNKTCSHAFYQQKGVCEDARTASSFYTNTSYPKFSKGFYPQLQFDTIFQPKTTLCYTRTYCKWTAPPGKCEDGKSDFVYQLVYTKEQCVGP